MTRTKEVGKADLIGSKYGSIRRVDGGENVLPHKNQGWMLFGRTSRAREAVTQCD